MRKGLIWTAVVMLVLLMMARLLYARLGHLDKERAWYISELDCNFSGRIDSLIPPGRALVSITYGDFDPDREWKLKKRLKYHGMLHLFISRKKGYDVRVPSEAALHDSLCINSKQDQLSLYRTLAISETEWPWGGGGGAAGGRWGGMWGFFDIKYCYVLC
jgi:hypothetical protein